MDIEIQIYWRIVMTQTVSTDLEMDRRAEVVIYRPFLVGAILSVLIHSIS